MTPSPVEPSDRASIATDEAFGLLGNETRVDILQALWTTFESGTEENALSYSELFDQVAVRDSGNFSYHLEKLTGPFVRRTDAGYELKQTGINVMRAVTAGTVTDDPAFGPTRVDATCPRCDAPVDIVYADELLTVRCSACPGARRWQGEAGVLFGALVPPVGIVHRSPTAVFEAAVTYSLNEIAAFHDGVCPHCSSPVETTVTVCREHAPGEEELCRRCDELHMAQTWMVCSTCKRSIPPPVALVALHDPDVTAFYHDHDVRHRFASWETVTRSFDVREEVRGTDPLRLDLTVPAGDDTLQLTLDETLTVLAVDL